MTKNKDSFRSKIKGMLFNFSSEEFQKAAWTNGTWQGKKVIYTPDEFVSMWFDDTFRNVKRLIENGKLNEKEWKIISDFHEFFNGQYTKFSEKKFISKHVLLLDYEPWKEMRKKAQETLDKLYRIGWDEIPIQDESL